MWVIFTNNVSLFNSHAKVHISFYFGILLFFKLKKIPLKKE